MHFFLPPRKQLLETKNRDDLLLMYWASFMLISILQKMEKKMTHSKVLNPKYALKNSVYGICSQRAKTLVKSFKCTVPSNQTSEYYIHFMPLTTQLSPWLILPLQFVHIMYTFNAVLTTRYTWCVISIHLVLIVIIMPYNALWAPLQRSVTMSSKCY